eukprot:gnl/TRDRNA2_/TRDRNA2_36302_c0_seq1.p1 gnl/TRDRNA2_/TRDRNA2_36302_c0~~gnl/TRDRNA2_/TRDRNA2_36302_c0_seq1.p1  ORF type:complete len:493 (+),score=85.71 gnl/TRDRNA2_/TRDRNA2_36302_c0_seq1:118-1596(+)
MPVFNTLPAPLAAKWLPRDLVESTRTGGIYTVLAYLLMLVVFVFELKGFMTYTVSSQLSLDHADSNLLQINFEVDLHDLECSSLKVVVFDQFGEERLDQISRDFTLQPLDGERKQIGTSRRVVGLEESDEDIQHQKLMRELEQADGKAELDADWATSHDGFHHQSFDHVVKFHDLTLINFFAGWCSHCQRFAPTWAQLAQEVNGDAANGTAPMKFPDIEGKLREVRVLKVNCVDFEKECRKQGIEAYPSIRLYKSDMNFVVFQGPRDVKSLKMWIEYSVKVDTYFVNHHMHLATGCSVRGHIQVPRAPGHLELMAKSDQQTLDPRMTNVSHSIRHLSFSDPDDGRYHRVAWNGLLHNQLDHVSPLDGNKFITSAVHQAYQHHLQVVSCVSLKGYKTYFFKNYVHLHKFKEEEVPQARFYFELEPFSIWTSKDGKPWYDFGTATMAMLGGVFVVMRLASRGTLAAHSAIARVKGSRRGAPRIGLDAPGTPDMD